GRGACPRRGGPAAQGGSRPHGRAARAVALAAACRHGSLVRGGGARRRRPACRASARALAAPRTAEPAQHAAVAVAAPGLGAASPGRSAQGKRAHGTTVNDVLLAAV